MNHLTSALLLATLAVPVVAQPCTAYFPLDQPGSTFEVHSYNAKGKPQGYVSYNIVSLDNAGNGTEAQVHATYYDDKAKLLWENDLRFACEAGVVQIDMRALLPAQQMASYQNMEMEATGDNLTLPQAPTAGQKLPPATITAKGRDRSSGVLMANADVRITNRQVEGQSSITTQMGTFNAWKITHDLESRSGSMGISIPFAISSVEYFVPGTGIVRSESYRKGKLMGYSELKR